jgi:peptide/nickel transport system substrate-binding protein
VDESALRRLIDDVGRGRFSRRQFVQAMSGLGVTAPMAVQMLSASGVAAEPHDHAFTPSRRGGGGNLRILMWDAPTLLHPHFGRGLRDFSASRIFYEPLAAAAPDGTFRAVLAEEVPSNLNGGVAKDGQWVVWRLKRNVVWHDGVPFTADDVIFNWEFAVDPATAASSRGVYEDIARVDKLDQQTVKIVFRRPQPFWARPFTGDGLLPRHIFQRYKAAGAREAFGNIKAVGTGPYRVVDFKPGDSVLAELNPQYHVPNRPFFDRLEIKGGGDAVSAARAVVQTGEYDFGYYILAEDDVLKRIEQGGRGGSSPSPAVA